jgi:hypothetical protein
VLAAEGILSAQVIQATFGLDERLSNARENLAGRPLARCRLAAVHARLALRFLAGHGITCPSGSGDHDQMSAEICPAISGKPFSLARQASRRHPGTQLREDRGRL